MNEGLIRALCFALAGLALAGCQASERGDVELVPAIVVEPQLLTDQLRVVSGYCGRRLFELRARPGTYSYTPKGRVDVEPLVSIRLGSTTRQYDKSEPFVAEMFRLGAPVYRFQMTCYPDSAGSEVQMHAYGVSYAGDQPVFSTILLVFSTEGAVLRYDNRRVSYDELHAFLR
ncbi:MAG: hypothetical protein JO256_03885 [Alphaproteobacteria bacterium]|nr:hypothetical protein [Alphaproteobacteria bacterium]